MQSTESSLCLLLRSLSFFDTLFFRFTEVFGIVSNIPLASTQVVLLQSFMLMSWWAPRMLQNRGWLPKEPTMWLEGWNFSVQPSSDFQGRERGWRLIQSPKANDLINHTKLMNLYKNTKQWGVRNVSYPTWFPSLCPPEKLLFTLSCPAH